MSAGDPAVATAEQPREGSFVLGCKVAFHTVLLLVLPFLVGTLTGIFADVSQVSETFAGLARFVATLLLPVLLVQGAGVVVKVQRERRARRAEGLTDAALLASVLRHVRVLTDKGLGLYFAGLSAVVLSLAFHFAELGMIAVLGLATLYLVVTAGMVLSTFVVARFEDRLATRGGSIGREFVPVVAEAGESVEERFHLERVPVPAGFNLRIHQALPARLATESRHVVGADVSRQRVSLARPLRRTPRGDYAIGPAQVAYMDLFGLTRVAVAQAASARLKVVPRFAPVVLAEAPRVTAPEEGVLSVLRKLPTDDYFRFRDYAPGDDTRRIHWKLSVKIGRLQVRLPETVPVIRRRVRLVLDNHLAPYVGDTAGVMDDLLDRLVELWLSLARCLTERGEEVVLVLPGASPDAPFEELPCRRGSQARWRELGARAAWQHRVDLHHIGPSTGKDQFFVTVTARFVPLPVMPTGKGLTWIYLPATEHLPGPVPGTRPAPGDAFLLPFSPGAEENGIFESAHRTMARRTLEKTRQRIVECTTEGGATAEAELRARGDVFYRADRRGMAWFLHPS